MKNILVVNVNWLGDVVFSSPIFYALKKKYPESRIVCLADPRVKGILNHIDVVDEIIEYDEKGKHKFWWNKFGIISAIARQKCDVAYMLHGSTTKALLVKLAGVKVRVGGSIKKEQRFLTDVIASNPSDVHRSDHYLRIVEGHGVPIEDKNTRLVVSEAENEHVQQMLNAAGVSKDEKVIGINIGANWDLKKWPAGSFKALIAQLIAQGSKVVLFGAQKDFDSVNDISKSFNPKMCINLAGKTSLDEMIVLLKRIDLFICADSGPLHIASSLGTDVIGLFGPTRPEITGPRGTGKKVVLQHDVGCNRTACYYSLCPDNVCMQAINISEVLKEVNGLLNVN